MKIIKQSQILKAIILFIIPILLFQSWSYSNDKHIGEWKGSEKSSLILDRNNHAILVFGNMVFGGENFMIQGKKPVIKYEIDYSKNPIWLDIVLYEEGNPSELLRLRGIVRFLTDTKIEYRVDFDGGRFESFDPLDQLNTMVLDKVKN